MNYLINVSKTNTLHVLSVYYANSNIYLISKQNKNLSFYSDVYTADQKASATQIKGPGRIY